VKGIPIFAEMRNVTKARVTQWITAGQISGAAIVGSGQRALIDIDLASAQLQERLATDERYGLSGLSTKISTTTISPRLARANAETFRHRIPAEADALEALADKLAKREAADAAKAARAVAPSSAQNCRTGGQPVRVDQVV
jgi:hypothetical protein